MCKALGGSVGELGIGKEKMVGEKREKALN